MNHPHEVEKNNIKLWILCNIGDISQEYFKNKTNQEFSLFFKENKKSALLAWNKYISEKRIREKSLKQEKQNCVCEIHENEKDHEVVWNCSLHGNCWNGIKNIK